MKRSIRQVGASICGWIERRAGVYGRACVLAVVFLTPIVVDRASNGPFNAVKVTVVWLFALAAASAMVSWSAERRVWLPRSRMAWAAGAFVAVCAAATAHSISPVLSALGSGDRSAGLVSIVAYALLLVAVVGLYWERPDRLRHVAMAACAASVVVAGSVLLQATGVDRTLWPGPVVGASIDHPTATIGNADFAGAYLGIVAPFVTYLALTARRRRTAYLLGAAVGVELVALWQTQSRSGMVGAAAGLCAMAFVARDRWPRWFCIGAVSVVLAVAVPLAVVVSWHPGADAPPERLAGLDVLRTRSLQDRLNYWGAAVRAVVHHPVLGTGPETFYASYTHYRRADRRQGEAIADKPHNIVLERATETGLAGGAVYLALVALGLRYGYRQARRGPGPARLLVAAFFGSLCGYLAQGMFSIDVPVLASIGWIVLGCLAALADPAVVARREAEPAAKAAVIERLHSPRPAWTQWLIHAPLVVGLCLAVTVGLRPLRAAVLARSGRLPDAIAVYPFDFAYRQQAGQVTDRLARATTTEADKRRLFTAAHAEYVQALRLHPRDINPMIHLARLEAERGEALDPSRFVVAEYWWQRVREQEPADRVRAMNGRRELEEAKARTLRRLLAVSRLRPQDPVTWRRLSAAYGAVGDSRRQAEVVEHLATLASARATR